MTDTSVWPLQRHCETQREVLTDRSPRIGTPERCGRGYHARCEDTRSLALEARLPSGELIRELDLFRRVVTAAIASFAQDNHDFTRSQESHARDLVDDAVNLVMLTSVRQLLDEQKRR